MKFIKSLKTALVFTTVSFASVSFADKCKDNWVEKSDADFAKDCADKAFSDDLEDREEVAWMFFARINQLIKDPHGLSEKGRVPQWMAWATDKDTFKENPDFQFTKTARDDLIPVTEKKLLAGGVSTADPDGANEEVTRNEISYTYLTQTAKLNTTAGVLKYLNAGNTVDMPVGTVELKASWLRVPPAGAPEGAMTFDFETGKYWWRGIHIMVKMRSLPKDKTQGTSLFYTEEPSWFWTTFEFTDNPGVEHVRDEFITQSDPLSKKEITKILTKAGISGFGFEAYTPNGTQIRYTVDGEGEEPVILGHTDMEDFAGWPNTAQPSYWQNFNSSCHTCHATAAFNPKTKEYFPFTVPVGKLTPQYYGLPNETKENPNPTNVYLGDGYIPLDFMWPIAFQAVPLKEK